MTVPPPPRGICGPALWSLLLLVAVLLLLRSRFFTTGGVVVDLPSEFPATGECVLTRHAVGVRAVDHYVFQGRPFDGRSLARELSRLSPADGEILLLHCDRRACLESLLRVCELARAAGFSAVQIAIPATP
jgi:biopolymer transport protein ExbD